MTLEIYDTYILHVPHLWFCMPRIYHFFGPMDPYSIYMMSSAFVAAYISLLHTSIVTHAHDPFSEFHNITIHKCRLLWSLPTVEPWVEFRLRYHDSMITENPGWDGPRFQIQGAWATITLELMLQEEFEQRGITMEIL